MIGKIIAIFLLMLVSFCASAEVNWDELERFRLETDCVVENGGYYSSQVQRICLGGEFAVKKANVKKARHAHSNKKPTESIESMAKKNLSHKHTRPAKDMRVGRVSKDSTSGKVVRIETLGQAPFGKVSDSAQLKAIQSFGKTWKQAQEILTQKRSGQGEVVSVPCGSLVTGGMIFRGGKKIRNDILLACGADAEHPNGNPEKVEVALKYAAEDGSYLYQFWKCRNWFGDFIPPTRPRPPVPTVEIPVAPPPEEPFKISLKPEENERQAIVELNAGVWGGGYFGKNYEGQFVGAQAWVYVPIERVLGTEEQISAGIGVYGSADWGDSRRTSYKSDSHRVLGLVGVKGNGFDEDFNPHWWSVNVGYGPDWLKGSNQDAGYWMNQRTWLVRPYADYLIQRGKVLYGAFGEGFIDVGGGSDYHSSWSGFPGEGRSSARIGGFVEYRFHPNWSAKGVAAMTLGQSDGVTSRYGVELGSYLCYRNGWDAGEGFAIGCAGAGVGIGQGGIPFVGANVFVGQVFSHYIDHERVEGVTYEPMEYQQQLKEKPMSRIPGASYPIVPVPLSGNGLPHKDYQPMR